MNTEQLFAENALAIPEILIPKPEYDLKKWAVVACDQYTQDRAYWQKACDTVGDEPSALKIIFPEVYLDDDGKETRIDSIKKTMDAYLKNGVFAPPVKGFVYIERETARGRTRKGLIVAVDLERYDWTPGSTQCVRATEATIPERIPPRMEIRRGAPLESPHIMLLINDPDKTFVEKAGETAKQENGGERLYATELMANSGSVSAWKLTEEAGLKKAADALSVVAKKSAAPDGSAFVFAVGDGNHSLATAKAVWGEHKKNGARNDHPARYALVEIVNLYDDGLTFEPIHRVLFGTTPEQAARYAAEKLAAEIVPAGNFNEAKKTVEASGGKRHSQAFAFIQRNKGFILKIKNPALGPALLQPALDSFMKENPCVKIDYIHGAEEAERLSMRENSVAVLLPPIAKDTFFTTIANGGPLPRKSFSMGEADEKRFYIECRKIM